MSKVKIQGNASGTGVVTLTAPNTNTDRTITLPDDTQTLIGTNASGNVGIGTAAPTRRLTVQGSSGDNVPIRVVGGAGTIDTFIDLKASNTTADYKVRVGAAADDLSLYAGGSERMRIDSAGRVTMPYQPAMTLTGNYQTYAPRTAAGIVKYNIALSGNITGWSNSLYRYTAPVAGMYQVSGWALINTAGIFEMRLRKNGVTNARYYETSSRTTSFTTLIYLNVNDYIEIHSDTDIYLHTTSPYSGLSISLHS